MQPPVRRPAHLPAIPKTSSWPAYYPECPQPACPPAHLLAIPNTCQLASLPYLLPAIPSNRQPNCQPSQISASRPAYHAHCPPPACPHSPLQHPCHLASCVTVYLTCLLVGSGAYSKHSNCTCSANLLIQSVQKCAAHYISSVLPGVICL
jgi:hypothetical protein